MRAMIAVKTAVLLTGLVLAGTCRADTGPKPDVNSKDFETQTILSGGGGIGLIGQSFPQGGTTMPISVRLAQRLRFPRHTSLGLELSFVVPIGLGVNVTCDVYRNDRVRIHLVDPGIHWNMVEPVSVSRVKRSWDLTLGAGLDVRLTDQLWLTVDWRTFLPDPTIINKYGDWARPIYKEAALGGQLWLGISRSW